MLHSEPHISLVLVLVLVAVAALVAARQLIRARLALVALLQLQQRDLQLLIVTDATQLQGLGRNLAGPDEGLAVRLVLPLVVGAVDDGFLHLRMQSRCQHDSSTEAWPGHQPWTTAPQTNSRSVSPT